MTGTLTSARRLGQGASDRAPPRPQPLAPRQAQASRLQARVDVFFRLIDDSNGQLLGLQDVPCTQVDIVRNRPSECDTASITLAGDALPFDLRVIADKSMFASVWLYEGMEPGQCRDGAPGQFFGVVDDVARVRGELAVSLSCRDMTAIPLQAMMPEGMVKAFQIAVSASVETVVEALLAQIPGTYRWTVESYTTAAYASPSLTPLTIKPVKSRRGSSAKPAPGLHLSDIVSAERLSVWSAITNVCARAGVVPEVRFGANGHPVVILVDSSALNTSDVLRPFDRGGRNWRVFVEGEVLQISEKLDLADTEGRPDFVEVGSVLPGGRRLAARWPQAASVPGAKPEKEHGLFQFVAGVSSEATLRDLAKAGYESLAHNQYKIELTLSEPWSAGGGPTDPDLLDLGYGAAAELVSGSFGRLAAVHDPHIAARIQAAQDRLGSLALLFQCAEVKHSWSNAPGYRCTIGIRQFLGRESLPVVRRGAPESRGSGDGLAL